MYAWKGKYFDQKANFPVLLERSKTVLYCHYILKQILPSCNLGFRNLSVLNKFLLVPIEITHWLKTFIFKPHCANYVEKKDISKWLVFLQHPILYIYLFFRSGLKWPICSSIAWANSVWICCQLVHTEHWKP